MSVTQATFPNHGIARWYMGWLMGQGRLASSPRLYLKEQLYYLRRHHGRLVALAFVRGVRDVGEYPGKERRGI